MRHFLHIKKEALKFASAHMTVFADGTKESIHGHNYRVDVEIETPPLSVKEMFPFSVIKNAMKIICQEWDEKLLLAQDCLFFAIKNKNEKEISFELCKKSYLVPTDEVVLLPIDNVTSENLANHFIEKLLCLIDKKVLKNCLSIRVRIDEMSGQGGSAQWKAKSKV